MAKQDVSVELYYDGIWNEIADETMVEEEISILWGQGSEGAAPRPGRIELTLDNQDDKYRVSNPESPLYGKAGRNTPVRVSVGGAVQMTGETTSMTPTFTVDWTRTSDTADGKPRGRSVVDVEANGLLQRVAQWTRYIKSPMTRYDEQIPGLLGYWPMEEDRTADTVRPSVGGSGRLWPSPGVNFGGAAGPPGSDPVPRFASDDRGTLGFFPISSGNNWQLFFSLRLPYNPGTTYFAAPFSYFCSNTNSGYIMFDGELFKLRHFVNGVMTELSVDGTDTDWTVWQQIVITCTVSGGTVTLRVDWWQLGSSSTSNMSGTYAGTSTGQPEYWGVGASDDSSGCGIGHVGGTNGVQTQTRSSDRWVAVAGHAGETAATRFVRIFETEEGIPVTFLGSSETNTVAMGPQKSGTLTEVGQDIVRTEDALVYDSRDGQSLVFRSRANRYNQTPAVALQWPTDVSPPFREVVDDLDTHNIVTLEDMYTELTSIARLDVGPMSTLYPPDGVGEYKQDIEVSVFDPPNQLPLLAGWWLNRGTLQRSRYPTITVDLVANPSLTADVEAIEPGDLITITGYEADTVPLIVIGIGQKIGSHRRTITLNTIPAELFIPGLFDAARYDSSSTTLAEDITSVETGWDIRTVNSAEVWSTTPGYKLQCNGEVVTVTGMTAASFSGGYYNQTATVTRSVNGIVRTHATGDEIHVYPQARYAL